MPTSTVRDDTLPAVTPVRDELIREIVLPRETGTHGDVLAAIGLADLLSDAAEDASVRVQERGGRFAVLFSRARRLSELPNLRATPGYRYLQPKSVAAVPTGVNNAIDYQAMRDRIKEVREQQSALYQRRRQTKDPAERQSLQDQIDALVWPMPPAEWRHYPPYLVLQGHETANKLLAEIVKQPPDSFCDQVRGGLAALAEQQPTGVAWKVNTVQIFSPMAAKGYARLKPDSTGRGDKTKDAWADPFLEWLRYRGYFKAIVPAFHGSKGEHIRLLCPVPGNVNLLAYNAVVQRLTAPGSGTAAAKIDILTVLQIAEVLVRGSEPHLNGSGDVAEEEVLMGGGLRPSEVISGLAVTNYQSLGSARAVSALSELAVPGWFPILTYEDANEWLSIIAEHRAIVRGLEDNHSDELALLLKYRRFLERRGDDEGNEPAVEALLDFAGGYGSHVIRAREAGRHVRQFSTTLFERVVEGMSTRLADILKNDGFRSVAAAVRRATVSAQIRKAQKVDHREIRYGLLPELRRTSRLADDREFLAEVAKFVDVYNAENARRQESTGRPWSARVSTDDLLAFTELVDEHHAPIVGALLCAYGTCTERRETGAGSATDEGEPVDSGEPVAGDPDETADESE